MNKNETRNTLLLGSGFSKNFGGYLPKDIYLKIFNHPDLTLKLRKHLLTFRSINYDFEGFYQSVIDNNDFHFTMDEIKIVEEIITTIYNDMDKLFIACLGLSPKFNYLAVINFLINKFAYAYGGSGYIFSLNQDLLIERLTAGYLKKLNYYNPGGWDGEMQGLLLPNYGPVDSPFYKYHKDDRRADAKSVQLGEDINQNSLDKWHANYSDTYEKNDRRVPCLVKLHGSFYWDKNSTEKLWLIGGEKENKIRSTPILNFYFNKFNHVMNAKNRLFIIGYGFNDAHINEVIENSCGNGTRLVVLDIYDFNRWIDEIAIKKLSGFSVDWIERYYNSFYELFPFYPDTKNFTKFDGNSERSGETLKSFNHQIE